MPIDSSPTPPILFVEQSHFKDPFPTASTIPLREAVETLRAEHIDNIHLPAGDDLLGHDGDATVEGCHPNDLGMARHADILAPALKELLNQAYLPY